MRAISRVKLAMSVNMMNQANQFRVVQHNTTAKPVMTKALAIVISVATTGRNRVKP